MDHYLRIEKLRLGDRLRIDIDADELPRDLPLPRLLLQPLVENAIYHGIQPLADGGTIHVVGRHVPGAVEITIRNPLPPEARCRGAQRHRARQHPRAHRVPFRHTWRAARRTRRRRICGDGAPSRCEP